MSYWYFAWQAPSVLPVKSVRSTAAQNALFVCLSPISWPASRAFSHSRHSVFISLVDYMMKFPKTARPPSQGSDMTVASPQDSLVMTNSRGVALQTEYSIGGPRMTSRESFDLVGRRFHDGCTGMLRKEPVLRLVVEIK